MWRLLNITNIFPIHIDFVITRFDCIRSADRDQHGAQHPPLPWPGNIHGEWSERNWKRSITTNTRRRKYSAYQKLSHLWSCDPTVTGASGERDVDHLHNSNKLSEPPAMPAIWWQWCGLALCKCFVHMCFGTFLLGSENLSTLFLSVLHTCSKSSLINTTI